MHLLFDTRYGVNAKYKGSAPLDPFACSLVYRLSPCIAKDHALDVTNVPIVDCEGGVTAVQRAGPLKVFSSELEVAQRLMDKGTAKIGVGIYGVALDHFIETLQGLVETAAELEGLRPLVNVVRELLVLLHRELTLSTNRVDSTGTSIQVFATTIGLPLRGVVAYRSALAIQPKK